MNPMRDRLVDLVSKAREKCGSMNCLDCKYQDRETQTTRCYSYLIVDCLLENGVIVPPCRVGDIIYALTHDRKDYMPLNVTHLESLVRWMDEDLFGNTLFTTREEAEQALKERR